MDKVAKVFLHSSGEHMASNGAFDMTSSDPALNIQDKRVAQLLVLLQELDESAEGLAALPKSELREVVSSAIGVCGFADPLEARDMIATVLNAIETQHGSIPKAP
jgi:hypothetical protein